MIADGRSAQSGEAVLPYRTNVKGGAKLGHGVSTLGDSVRLRGPLLLRHLHAKYGQLPLLRAM